MTMKRYTPIAVFILLFVCGGVWAGFGVVHAFLFGAFFAVPFYCLGRLFWAIVHRLERNDGRRS